MYALSLFGGLSLTDDAGPIAPAALQRRRLALLALLALGGDRGVARERVQAQLWPESPPDRARHALDQLLYATRRDLGSDVVVSAGGELRLNGDLVRTDVRLFDAAVADGRWADAVALYAGPLLDGLHLADDVDFERTVDAEPDSAWVRQNPWVLSNFGHIAAAAGQHARAVALIEAALRVAPTHPRLLRDLAYAHARAGDPARARAAFARADSAHPHYPVYRALLHATLGELDAAFAWLDRVDEWPLPSLVGLSNDPVYAALRADPRYAAVRRRLALPPR